MRHGLERLQQAVDRFRNGQRADALDAVLEVLALEQLHHDERPVSFERADIHDANDVLALEPGDGPRLAEEAIDDRAVVRQVRREHLQRDGGVEKLVVRREDGAHAALADDGGDAVLASHDIADRKLHGCGG